ncbi:MAG TPA: hypothetical protein VFQ53_19475 [Kofleriaceae bacterium]|nr:hypothetical protein [Kofleriaceae bacterium]
MLRLAIAAAITTLPRPCTPPPTLTTACIAETAVATTIVLAPDGTGCGQPDAPGVFAIALWQTAHRLPTPIVRSWTLDRSKIARVYDPQVGEIRGTVSYSWDPGASRGEVAIDVAAPGWQLQAKVPIASFVAGD